MIKATPFREASDGGDEDKWKDEFDDWVSGNHHEEMMGATHTHTHAQEHKPNKPREHGVYAYTLLAPAREVDPPGKHLHLNHKKLTAASFLTFPF